jgi:hypothetical protein
MKNELLAKRVKVSSLSRWLFLLLFTMALFPRSGHAQSAVPLQNFECSFENLDGNLLYPCASKVRANIVFPANVMGSIVLTLPNTIQAVPVTSGVTAGTANLIATGGAIMTTPYLPNDLYSQEFTIPSGITSIQIELTYMGCNVFDPLQAANTTLLFFDCDGIGLPPNASTTYLATIVSPAAGTSGLTPSNGVARANYPIAPSHGAIEVLAYASPLVYNGYNGFSANRDFKVLIYSQSITQFNLNIPNDGNYDAVGLYVVGNSSSNPFSGGTGSFPIVIANLSNNSVNLNPITGVRTIIIKQEGDIACGPSGSAAITASLTNCGSCNDIISTPLGFDYGLLGGPTFGTPISSLEDTSSTTAIDPQCNGTNYAYTIKFRVTNFLNAKLKDIVIPINTESFSYVGVQVGSNTGISSTFTSNTSLTNPGNANSELTISVNDIYTAPLFAAAWPGFSIIPPASVPGGTNGAWFNGAYLYVRVLLSPNFQISNDCPTPPIILSNPGAQITLNWMNSCDQGISPQNYNLNTISTVNQGPIVVDLVLPPHANNGAGALPINGGIQFSIPSVSPFQINAGNLPQLGCQDIGYRAILSVSNMPAIANYSIGTLVSPSITANGVQIPAGDVTIANNGSEIIIEWPATSNPLPFNSYIVAFQLQSIDCPDPYDANSQTGTGMGTLQYHVELQAVCLDCANPMDNIKRIACSLPDDVMIHCPGPCESAVDTYDDVDHPFVVQRETYGWASPSDFENGMAPFANAAAYEAHAISQGVSTVMVDQKVRTLYPHDIFHINAQGLVKPINGQNHNTLTFEISFPATNASLMNVLSLMDFTIDFTSNGNPLNPMNGVPFTQTDFPGFAGGPTFVTAVFPILTDQYALTINMDVNTLTLAGVNVNDFANNPNGWNIHLNARLRVNANAPVGFHSLSLNCQFRSVSGANTPNTTCDIRGRDITILVPDVEIIQNSVNSGNINLPETTPNVSVGTVTIPAPQLCHFGHAVGIRHLGGLGGIPDFVEEFRPISRWPFQLAGANVNSVDDFNSGPNAYTLNLSNWENAAANQRLLPSRSRALNTSIVHGLLLGMDKDCPVTQNDLNLYINEFAYIHTGHQLTSLPSELPAEDAEIGAPTPVCSGMTFPLLPPAINSLTNGLNNFNFTMSLPTVAAGQPTALQIVLSDPTNVNLNNLTFNSSQLTPVLGSPGVYWYYFNNGGSSPSLGTNVTNATLPIVLQGPNGCFDGQFEINFNWFVYCDQAPISLASSSCYQCSQNLLFKRGGSSINNLILTSDFTASATCNLQWDLILSNPSNQPLIDQSNLNLTFSTGLVFNGAPMVSVGNGATYGGFSSTANLINQGGFPSTSFVENNVVITNLEIPPGGSITYGLTFGISEDFCVNVPAFPAIEATLDGKNICDETFDFGILPIDMTQLNSAIGTLITNGCCVLDPAVEIIHACGSPAEGAEIKVINPNSPVSPIEVTLSFPVIAGVQTPTPITVIVNGGDYTFNPTNTNNPLGPGLYTLTVWNPVNAGFFTQIVEILDLTFSANIQVNPSTVQCGGSQIQLSAQESSSSYPIGAFPLTYNWTPGNQTTNPITVAPQTTTNYAVTVSNGSCTALANTTVNVNPLPTPPIVNNVTVCQTTPASLNAVLQVSGFNANYSYNWYNSSNQLVGSGLQYTVTAPTVSSIYYVQAVDNVTNCATAFIPVNVTVVLPVISALGPVSFCNGGSVTLQGNYTSGFWMVWRLNGVDLMGNNSDTLVATQSGYYDWYITDQATGCGVASGGIMVNVDLPVIPTFTQIAPVCLNAAAPVLPNSSNNVPAITGTWNATVNTAVAGTTTYTFTPDAGLCATTATMNITVNPLPNAPVAAPVTICQTNPPSIDANLVVTGLNSNFTLTWYDASYSQVAVAGNYVVPTPTTSAMYYVQSVSNATQCASAMTAVPLTVGYLNPGITASVGPPLGPVSICSGGSVTLTCDISSGVIYKWLFNGSLIPAANAVSYDALQAGNYMVFVTDPLSNCSYFSNTINVVVDAPVTISGPSAACSQNADYCLPANFDPNDVLGWTFNGSPIATNPSNPLCVTMDWSQYGYFGGTFEVITNQVCGSSGTITMLVSSCCSDPSVFPIVNENLLSDFSASTQVSYAMTVSGYQISGQTFVLDNTSSIFSCDADLIIDGCTILMAAGQRLDMLGQKHLTLINTNIMACDYRHKGIKAINGNSIIDIYGGQIEGADIAVEILKGNLILTNAGFERNLNHVFSKRSRLSVDQCYFYCNGFVVPENSNAPNNQTTLIGIYILDNTGPVSIPTVGNSKFYIGEFGIYAYNSGLYCGGNGFDSFSQMGIFVNNNSMLDLNCTIGVPIGPNSLSNCSQGILTRGRLSHLGIHGNYIMNSSNFGIKVQMLGGREFDVVQNEITDSKSGILLYSNSPSQPNSQRVLGNIINGNTLGNGFNIDFNGIIAKEASLGKGLVIQGNSIELCRRGIEIFNVSSNVSNNRIRVNHDLSDVVFNSGIPSAWSSGISLNGSPKSIVTGNQIWCEAPFPSGMNWASWLTTGIRVDNCQGSMVCGNASSLSTDPNTGNPAEIGTGFEFHGDNVPTNFKNNKLDSYTSRGLFLGGMPYYLGGSGNIIGVQGTFDGGLWYTRDNTWNNPFNVYDTDFRDASRWLNLFRMNSTPPANNYSEVLLNGPSPITYNDPNWTFAALLGGEPTEPCWSNRMMTQDDMLGLIDTYDDIARDSAAILGGNDTSRYFGKEFLYAEMMSEEGFSAFSDLVEFKTNADQSNLKHIYDFKQALVYPLDQNKTNALNAILARIAPKNNIESIYKEVFELALRNPELKDSVYSATEIERLKAIASMCPYVDGNGVYTARVLLSAFEPNVNYFNSCEVTPAPAKKDGLPAVDQSAELLAALENNKGTVTEYKVIPNPNNGTFQLLSSSNEAINCEISDIAGRIIESGNYKPNANVVQFSLNGLNKGIYHLKVVDNTKITTIKIVIN